MYFATASPSGMKERTHMNRAARQYLQQMKREIPCSHSLKAVFLRQLEGEVFLYCEEHQDADVAALTQRFGTPEDVANDFLAELGTSSAAKAAHNRQRVLFLLILVAVTVLVLTAAVGICAAYRQQKVLDGYYVESITYEGTLTPDVTGATYAVEHFGSGEDTLNH